MIDEKVLIERLEEEQEKLETDMWAKESNNWYGQHCNGVSEGYDNSIEIVKDLASEHNNGWIPCEVRLPEDDKNRKYLVCGKSGGIYIAEFVCKAVSNNTSIGPWWSSSGRYCPSPIAWQPLPAPYKKGE